MEEQSNGRITTLSTRKECKVPFDESRQIVHLITGSSHFGGRLIVALCTGLGVAEGTLQAMTCGSNHNWNSVQSGEGKIR